VNLPRVLADDPPERTAGSISAQASWLVMDMLSDPDARRAVFGADLPLDMPFKVAAKTGTSSGFADTVAIGATSEAVAAAWAGDFDGSGTRGTLAMWSAARWYAQPCSRFPIWRVVRSPYPVRPMASPATMSVASPRAARPELSAQTRTLRRGPRTARNLRGTRRDTLVNEWLQLTFARSSNRLNSPMANAPHPPTNLWRVCQTKPVWESVYDR